MPPGSGMPMPRPSPDAQAPSDLSYARAGVLAAGMGGARAAAMRGTSVAAPQITRWIAHSMQVAGGGGTRAEVANAAANEETGRTAMLRPAGPYEPLPPSPARVGAGRIDSVPLPPANRIR